MKDIHKLLAKSIKKNNTVYLLPHLKNCSTLAQHLAKISLNDTIDETVFENIKYSSLFHDIGKAIEHTQSYFRTNKKNPSLKHYHNEIGWAFCVKYININSDVLNAIYFHHGIYGKVNSDYADEILSKCNISDDDIETMKNVCIELLDENIIKNFPSSDSPKTPLYYNKAKLNSDHKLMVIRTILISADRITSELQEKYSQDTINENNIIEYAKPIIDNILYKKNGSIEFNLNEKLDIGRFNKQKEIVDLCNSTVMLNAPAGFGKTLVSILWSLKNNKKTIIVMPRNNIAESLYASVLDSLDLLGIIDKVTLELYLSGEVKKSNINNYSGFDSDIIITNIDNFLAPTRHDNISNRLFLILNANIVFDEYHELMSQNNSLFPAFILFLKIRHRLTNNETLLMSATPIYYEGKYSWISVNKDKLTILPEKGKHYKATHDRVYKFIVKYGFKFPKKFENNSNLIIYNSIKKAQEQRNEYKDSILYHSNFTDEKKSEILSYLLENFGKNRKIKNNKQTIISTQIIQASLDVSFNNVGESIQSPESTAQRLGRDNRFGDSTNEKPIMYIFKLKDDKFNKNEEATNSLFYDKNLTNAWFDDCRKNLHNKEITLDEYYEFHNKHILEYQKPRDDYFDSKFMRLYEKLENIYPKRMQLKDIHKPDSITITKNNYRINNNSIFFIVEEYGNPDNICGPFSWELRKNFATDFEENEFFSTGMYLDKINKIEKLKDPRFDFSKIMKKTKVNMDWIRELSINSKTPYFSFNLVYHKEFGLIKPSTLNNFFNK